MQNETRSFVSMGMSNSEGLRLLVLIEIPCLQGISISLGKMRHHEG